MSELLIIMARSPELGKVKSRLAKTIGEERALEVYLKLLSHTIQCAKDSGFKIKIFVDGDINYFENGNLDFEMQSGGDIGTKMKDAFLRSFSEGHDRIVMIGTDCFEMNSDTIRGAFHAFALHDIVLGPAKDGGYYLIGMKKMHDELFESMPWSTDFLLIKTIEKARLLGLSIATLPIKNDIDEEKDLDGTNL
jgi:rSAM/selenodomain-associated transferase 1